MKHIFLIILILCAFTTQNIFSQNAPVSTIGTISSNMTTATVPIRAINFTNIGSCNLKLTYNPAIATATSVTLGNPLLGNFLSTDLSVSGVITLGWFASPGVTIPNNPVIFNISFSKVSNGTSALIWDDGDGYSCQWSDGDYNDLDDIPAATYYINGSLSFGNAPVTTAPGITACPGTMISVPVTVSAFSNIGALSLTMNYNPSALSYQSFVNNSGFPGLTVDGVSNPGTIITGGSSSAVNGITLSDNTVLYTLNFNYSGGVSALDWSDNGSSCEYKGPSPAFQVLQDTPFSTFYLNGTMTGIPVLPVSVSIVADANPVIPGTLVSFAATPANGGTSPAFQWNVNNSDIAGATNSTYAYIPVNNDAVFCRMTSDLSCVSGNPATSNTVIMVVHSIPQNTTVQDIIISSGQSECYNALQSIIVAGGSSIFVVENNGSATFIAGELIRFLPGTTVDSGGYMLGQIAPAGPYCGGIYPAAAAMAAGEEESIMQVDRTYFVIYPNPTAGNFTLISKKGNQEGNLTVEIYGMRGEQMFRAKLPCNSIHDFSLTAIPAGLYFVNIIAADHSETIKLVKTR